jgi:hypothetical protein
MAIAAPDWRAALARDTDSVFRSFWALAWTAPLIVASSALSQRAAMKLPGVDLSAIPAAPPMIATAVDLLSAMTTWVVSLALLLAIARRTGLAGRAADIVVGWNWIQPMTVLAAIPTAAVAAATGNASLAGVLAAPALALPIALAYGFVRRALEPTVGVAIGIVVLLILTQTLVELFENAAMTSIYGGS